MKVRELEVEHEEPVFTNLSHKLKYEREQLEKNKVLKAKVYYDVFKEHVEYL